MNQEEAFLRAVCENPDDDAVRLIFADWLEEHGQPERAEFIRLQVELAQLPEWDRRWEEYHTHQSELEVREYARLPQLPQRLSWDPLSFRRGFAEGIQLMGVASFLQHAETVFAAGPVRHLKLDLALNLAGDLTALADSPWLARLRSLEMHCGRLDEMEVRRLCNSPHAGALRSLAFRSAPGFRPAGITGAGVRGLLTSPTFQRLTTLDLGSNKGEHDVVRPFVDALAAVPGPVQLTTLKLYSTEFGNGAVAALARSTVTARLAHLNLQENPIQAAGFAALAASPLLSRLQVLHLGHTQPGVPGIRALAESPHLTGLRWLDLRYNRIGPVAARLLAGSPNLKHLTTLDLRNNPLGDKGARALAESPHLRDLVKVDLAGCEIGDAGVRALLGWPALANVVRLDLYDNPIRDDLFSKSMKQALRQRFGNRVNL
jgi:uncharacterized protein (TIGR02996 family)